MPIINVQFIAGPSDEQQQRLVTAVTDAVQNELAVPRETITVLLQPITSNRWASGGETLDIKLGL